MGNVAIASIQCCYAETVIDTEEQFERFVYETGWRASASEVANNPSKNKWYNKEIYKDSIYKVIPQAIADYMQRKAEFENVGEIVKFKANDHTQYSYENWNAVVLWNYLEYALHNKGKLNNAGVSEVGTKLKEYYEKDYWEYINNAVSDIQAYANALELYWYVEILKEGSKYVTILKPFDQANISGKIKTEGNIKYNDTIIKTNIYITIENGKVASIDTDLAEYRRFKTMDECLNVSQPMVVKEEPENLNLEQSLLDADKIHAFANYINVPGRIAGNKCYMTATLTALYNSPRFRATIEKLANMPKEAKEGVTDWQVSVAIKKLFGIIEGKTGVDEQDELMAELIDRMERTDLIKARQEIVGTDVPETDVLGKSEYRTSDYKSANEFLKDVLRCLVHEIETHNDDTIDRYEYTTFTESEYGTTRLIESDKNYGYTVNANNHENLNSRLNKYKGFDELTQKWYDISTMPKTLPIYVVADEQYTCPETLTISTTKGNKTYKAISTVEHDKELKHFVARVRTKRGWYEVDSLGRKVRYLGDNFIETLPSSTRKLEFTTVIYEQIS